MLPSAIASIDPRVVLVGIVMAALLVTLVMLAVRSRRKRRVGLTEVQPAAVSEPAAIVDRAALDDGAALLAAVEEAEAEGASHRLPGLYLSLARWRLAAGETRAAQEALRKCIRNATGAGTSDAHASARVLLGDIAQSSGDPVTACEHWQIARRLFHELKDTKEYSAVDARMIRNGCPTDWVLTDF